MKSRVYYSLGATVALAIGGALLAQTSTTPLASKDYAAARVRLRRLSARAETALVSLRASSQEQSRRTDRRHRDPRGIGAPALRSHGRDEQGLQSAWRDYLDCRRRLQHCTGRFALP